MYLIGIDVGGTHTKFGLIKDGTMLKTLKVSTNTFDVIRQIANGARELAQSSGVEFEDVAGIAVGFPGMVVDNIVKDSPNIGLQNCDIQEIFRNEFGGKPVIAMNDAELAVLAEHKMGAGNSCDNMVLITIGTGVGGGVIVDGQLYVGKGGAGELGHIVLEPEGLQCKCGRKGCAEQYISLTALDRITRELASGYPDSMVVIPNDSKVDGSDLVKAYKRNDGLAIMVVNKYVKLLKDYILNICNLLRPDKVVIGGGLCHAPEIIEMVAKECKAESYGFNNSPSVEIVPAKLGNDAGILGAVVCFEGMEVEETPIDLDKINDSLAEKSLEEESQRFSQEANQINSENVLENMYLSSMEEVSDNQVVDEEDSEIVYDANMLERLNEKLKR